MYGHNKHTLIAASLIALAAIPQVAVQAAEGDAEWAEEIEARQDALGITRIEGEDGTYYYGLPADLETPEVIEENGVVWQYDGQARFPIDKAVYEEELPFSDDELEGLQSLEEQVLGSTSVDEYGRRWLAVDVDQAGLEGAVEAYDEEVASLFGLEPDHGIEDDSDPVSEAGSLLPLSRPTIHRCTRRGPVSYVYWGSDTRQASTIPMTLRQEKSVFIAIWRSGNASPVGCSGTMVDDEWVLTAAHCITDLRGRLYDQLHLRVCTHGNDAAHDNWGGDRASCHAVNRATLPRYRGATDISDDYAVVRVRTKPRQVGWMPISRAANAVIEAAPAYTAGYPGRKPDCTSGNTGRPQHSTPNASMLQHWASADLFTATRRKVKTELPAGPGQSGSPIYYYPGGCCGAHFLTGVLVGHVRVGRDYTGGPKGSAIRSWVAVATP